MPRRVDLEGRVHHGSVRVLLPGVEHEVHAVADLGQGVDTALVPPAVQEPSLGDDQRPVVRINLRPGNEKLKARGLKGSSIECAGLSEAIISAWLSFVVP